MDQFSVLDHPFFQANSRWRAEGWYQQDDGEPVTCIGTTTIREKEDRWIITSDVHIFLLSHPDDVQTVSYVMEPLDESDSETYWGTDSTALGPLTGRYAVIGDSLMSTGTTADGHYAFTECMLLTDDETYDVRGLFSHDSIVLCRWSLTLSRLAA